MSAVFGPLQGVCLDADDTLFHFHGEAGLRATLESFGLALDETALDQYRTRNSDLWARYQAGEISAQILQETRFQPWAEQLGIAAGEIQARYQDTMVQHSPLIEGALELLDALAQRWPIAIITNGFARLQHARLLHAGIADRVRCVVISEEVGVAKPDPRIFAHALGQLRLHDPSRVLMVGDKLDTDVLGGRNAGMRTCWFNPLRHAHAPEAPVPDAQVDCLHRLRQLLTG